MARTTSTRTARTTTKATKAAAANTTKETPVKKTAAAKPAAEKPAPLNACGCGCGETTKRNYAPGHDARHAGQVGRWLVEQGDALTTKQRDAALAPLPSEALKAKALGVLERHTAKAETSDLEKQARAAAKVAAKAAYDAAYAAFLAEHAVDADATV